MNIHEREFFVSTIRSGKVIIKVKDLILEILPLTLDQLLESNLIYNSVFLESYRDDLMTEYEMQEWMSDTGLWTFEDEQKTDSLKKDMERLKIEIYNNRYERKNREEIRKYLRVCEEHLSKHLSEKSFYFQNTRESYALTEKISWVIRNTTYCNNELYDFSSISFSYVLDEWQNSILSEKQIRELAREEPWKSFWSIKSSTNAPLFKDIRKYELTTNQKNLVLWSQIYDSIQESIECPEDIFIKDDDVLDGWFIAQSQKRKKEQIEREMNENELKNEKIKNSNEVFVVTSDKERAARVNMMNDPAAAAIKKQRFQIIKDKKTVKQSDLPDEKLALQMQINNLKRNS